MKPKQIILLFLALLLPVCVFLFLKGFGKNEFSVPVLFSNELPPIAAECNAAATVPYHIPDSSLRQLNFNSDSIALLFFENQKSEQKLSRVKESFSNAPLKVVTLDKNAHEKEWRCIYFLQEPFDVVLVDKKGSIRGQYNSNDRDEMDRLLMELAIIFRRY